MPLYQTNKDTCSPFEPFPNVALPLEAIPLPLHRDSDNRIRVGGTRIPLDRVVECYQQGYTPEDTVDAFDSLQLADVYATIAYYLYHREEVDVYLRVWEEK